MHIASKTCLALTTLVVLGIATAHPARAQVVTFDTVSAPSLFTGATYSPHTQGGVTFENGVILNDNAFALQSTTSPNLYATEDFVPLADSNVLPGLITGTFASAGLYNGIGLDIANGFVAGQFTLSAYDAGNTLISSASIHLDAVGSGSGAIGHVGVSGAGIKYFTVTSDQAAGDKDFAIDTVQFSPVPEASSLVSFGLMLLGGAGAFIQARTRKVPTA